MLVVYFYHDQKKTFAKLHVTKYLPFDKCDVYQLCLMTLPASSEVKEI